MLVQEGEASVGLRLAIPLGVSGSLGIVIMLAALAMFQLRFMPLAQAGSLLAMLPLTAGCFLGLPMGIWALIVLRRPEVIAAFGRRMAPMPLASTPVATQAYVPAIPTAEAVRSTPPASTPPAAIPSVTPVPTPVKRPSRLSLPPLVRNEEDLARRLVKGPAIGLLVAGILYLLSLPSIAVLGDVSWRKIITGLMGLLWGPLLILASVRMRQFSSYRLVLAGAIAALIPVSTGIMPLSLAVGIWALVRLNRPEVKKAFADKEAKQSADRSI